MISSKYSLTDKQREELYEYISWVAFKSVSPDDSTAPTYLVIGGEMGSGKSTLLVPQAVDEYKERGKLVVVDTDEIRLQLPYYHELLRDPFNGREANKLTQPDAAYLARRLLDEALERHCNVCRVTAFGPRSSLAYPLFYRYYNEFLLQKAKEGGYQPIEIRLLAASWLVCRLAVYQRYEREMATTRMGRFTDFGADFNGFRYDLYDGPDSPGARETLDLTHRVRVVTRSSFPNSIYDAAADRKSEASKVWSAERHRSLSREERLLHLDAWGAVLKSMSDREAEGWQIESARRLALADTLRLVDADEGLRRFQDSRLAAAYRYLSALSKCFHDLGLSTPEDCREKVAREIEFPITEWQINYPKVKPNTFSTAHHRQQEGANQKESRGL